MSINRVVISGNLTRDPELRSTPSGMAVLQLGIAVNDRRKNPQSGEWEDVPNFFDVVVFGQRGESVSKFLSKGSKIAVEGKLRWSSWDDKTTGAKRSKVEIIADDIEFMSSRGEGGGSGGGYSAPAAKPQADSGPETFEDDIPF
jgi:single-strand DNA-binding protein